MKILSLGHATFVLTTSNNRVVYLDPWISENPVCPIKLEQVHEADIVCVTHGHRDHFGDALELVKRTKAILVCSPDLAKYAESTGVNYGQLFYVDGGSYPLDIGGSVTIKDTEIVMTNALHTSELRTGTETTQGSGSCGYVITDTTGIGVYHAGDTALFSDMKLIRELYQPRVCLLPVGGRYNMGIREAAIATSFLSPNVVIPMHYDTYPTQKADIKKFAEMVNLLAPRTQVIVLKPGESTTYPTST